MIASAEQSDQPRILARGEDGQSPGHRCEKSCSTTCCSKPCIIICSTTLILVVGFILYVVFNVWTTTCAVAAFPFEQILPANAKDAGVPAPFDMGTDENMKLDSALGLDLTGTWWMDGNELTSEQLVSFAGADGTAPYPTLMTVRNNKARRWTWSDDLYGRGVMAYYALTEVPEAPLVFNFTNSSYAEIKPVGDIFDPDQKFLFEEINLDEWNRTYTYILRRIVYQNGTAQSEYWPKFVDWYKATHSHGNMAVWSSDNDCLRKCQYFAPCSLCNYFC